jgi:hypothetical protein
MSGLLQGLAAEALDLPRSMRPLARWRDRAPALPPTTDVEEARASVLLPGSLEAPRPAPDGPAPEDEAPFPASTGGPESRRAHSRRGAAREPEHREAAPRWSSPPEPAASPTRPPAKPSETQAARPLPPVAGDSTALPLRGPDRPSPGRTPEGASDPLGRHRAAVAPPRPPEENGGERPRDPRPVRPPLLEARTAGRERLPDVHIHIERVELTAVSAPAPRGSAGRTAKKPMSLDDYLQRRSRKAP